MLACRIRNPGTFCLWNRKPWVLQSGIQVKETRVPLTTVIQNPRSTESGIQGMDSKIQYSLGFPYMGRRKTRFSTRWGGNEEDPLCSIFVQL